MNPYKPAMMGWDFPFSNLQPHLSSEKIQVICLYLGDDKLPSYIGIFFISQYMDPREPTIIQWNVIRVLFHLLTWL